MKTRILHTKIYKDSFFCELTPTEKLLFIYFITNEKVNIIHCYEITDRETTFDTGVDKNTIATFKEKMIVVQKMFFKGNWVYLRNSCKYEKYVGDKNENAKDKLISEMNSVIKDWYISILDTPIDTPIDRGQIGTISHNTEIIIHKSKSMEEQLDEEFCKEIALKYKVSMTVVIEKRNDLVLYCRANGKKYKDYQSALQNWLRKDLNAKTR